MAAAAMASGRRASHISLTGEDGIDGRRVSASVADEIDEQKVITGLNLTSATSLMINSLFANLDADGNGALEPDDFVSAGMANENFAAISAFFDFDESPLTINKFFLGLKKQATNPENPEKSVLANWINTLDANTLGQVTVKVLIDEVQNKLNQGVGALVSEFVAWLTRIHRDEYIQKKPVQYQLDEDIQAVAAINFTEKSLNILQNLWNALDADGSGDLTMEDMILLCGEDGAAQVPTIWGELIKAFDDDNDNTITGDEFRERFVVRALQAPCCLFRGPDETGAYPWKASIINFLEELQRVSNQAITDYALSIAAAIPAVGDITRSGEDDASAGGGMDRLLDDGTPSGGGGGYSSFTLSGECKRRCLFMFNALGTCGSINADDVKQKIASTSGLAGLSAAQVMWEELRQLMDVDGNNTIDYDEFEAGLVQRALNTPGGASIMALPAGNATSSINDWHGLLNTRLNAGVVGLLDQLNANFGMNLNLNTGAF